jgi:hypothetical protein
MIDLWEGGGTWHPIDQALLMLRYGTLCEGEPELSDWSIGQRDRYLIEIRRATFGDRIESYVECPACGKGLEFELSCDALLDHRGADHHDAARIEANGIVWECRVPTSRDLAVVMTDSGVRWATRELLTRCVRTVGGEKDLALDDASHAALMARISTLDPLAEILIDLTCPHCGETWQSLFDVVTFLWNEVRTQARRLLQEVDLLARTYGWTETETLRLSDRRRASYIQMALA